MNKSLITNLIALGAIGAGYISHSDHLIAVGLFATSGALTNWLAVHMLFEKVPLLYGSGVVPNRFEDFKTGIHALIMNQFFTAENIEKFLADQTRDLVDAFDPDPVLNAIDYDRIFGRLVDGVMASPLGGMLNILGGANVLHPLKKSFTKKIRAEIRLLLTSPNFLHAIQEGLGRAALADDLIAKVDAIVVQRLDELTPEMVKTIVRDMIRKHLGWLVVWGGVFGGLIGLMTSFVR